MPRPTYDADASAPVLRQPFQKKQAVHFEGPSIRDGILQCKSIDAIDRAMVKIRQVFASDRMSRKTFNRIEKAAEKRKGELRAAKIVIAAR